MRTADIRSRFLDHFIRRDHTEVPSASLIADDPTLLLVNAGMVPFKPYLLGAVTPPWPRATSVQKCVRTVDIDEVGKTTRHNSFFQMNGNFSFGDYFKAGAIRYAWELMTGTEADGGFGFDESRLWVTVYTDDDEAEQIWRRDIGVSESRIQRLGRGENFWSMGVPGPCGPCSEINYDRGPEFGREGGPAVDGERFVELWNLVFMQYERGPGNKEDFPILGDLPARNIDTGMGLERMAMVLQGVDNVYEIDQTFPVLDRAAEMTGRRYGADHTDDVRLRVVADHVRTALMLIADGVTPGNEGRGYVLRRILRRSVRAMRLLGHAEPVLGPLLAVSRDAMSASYPEVAADFERIEATATAEEDAFGRTLAAGTTILDTAVRSARQAGRSRIGGDQAFALHDTYGFPIDLTIEMAAEQGVAVDEGEFRRLMGEQRDRAKADARSKKGGGAATALYRGLLAGGDVEFNGYHGLTADSTVRAILADGEQVELAEPGGTVEVVLDRTPFYAESGGQIADEGIIRADGATLRVIDVQRPIAGLIVHRVQVEAGIVRSGSAVHAEVDREWRMSACQAHSGTHVVHAALRQVLGSTALQSGSYNRPGYLRLDFAWRSALDLAAREEIESVANGALRADLPVSAQYMTLAEAKESGALALFGETYGEQVRVVEIGGPWSRELCGGTHVRHSSQVGALSVTGEASVGAGVRRLEAWVGLEAMRRLSTERALVAALSDTLKSRPDELVERVDGLLSRLHAAEKEIAAVRDAQLRSRAGEMAGSARDVYGVAVVTARVDDGVDGKALRALLLDIRGRLSGERPALVALTSVTDGRASFVVGVTDEARHWGLSARDLMAEVGPLLGGKGGGSDELAQGGGSDVDGLDAALTSVDHQVAQRVTRSA